MQHRSTQRSSLEKQVGIHSEHVSSSQCARKNIFVKPCLWLGLKYYKLTREGEERSRAACNVHVVHYEVRKHF